mmetsp:Transcript_44849/g.136967  ORF Transcript_44849/g.136967 Transcript_44849/m.136967 type:complete len:453 (-) Transcript_44849:167-1525(-)
MQVAATDGGVTASLPSLSRPALASKHLERGRPPHPISSNLQFDVVPTPSASASVVPLVKRADHLAGARSSPSHVPPILGVNLVQHQAEAAHQSVPLPRRRRLQIETAVPRQQGKARPIGNRCILHPPQGCGLLPHVDIQYVSEGNAVELPQLELPASSLLGDFRPPRYTVDCQPEPDALRLALGPVGDQLHSRIAELLHRRRDVHLVLVIDEAGDRLSAGRADASAGSGGGPDAAPSSLLHADALRSQPPVRRWSSAPAAAVALQARRRRRSRPRRNEGRSAAGRGGQEARLVPRRYVPGEVNRPCPGARGGGTGAAAPRAVLQSEPRPLQAPRAAGGTDARAPRRAGGRAVIPVGGQSPPPPVPRPQRPVGPPVPLRVGPEFVHAHPPREEEVHDVQGQDGEASGGENGGGDARDGGVHPLGPDEVRGGIVGGRRRFGVGHGGKGRPDGFE